MSATAPLIIDCDPGLDDAVAILLALASPDEFELLGISTVAGNVPLTLCNDNARKICELAGRADIAVHPGCPRPILYPLVTATEVHGDSGIGRAELAAPQMPLAKPHGVDFIINTLRQRDDVILCPIGPLTNIALAFIKAPELIPRVKQIVLMGGAMARGNVTPAAEFNFYVDPHAAQVVLDSGAPITMLGLDATHQVLVTPTRLKTIEAIGTPVATAVAAMLGSLPQREQNDYGGNPLHDPCVIAQLLRPSLSSGRHCRVDVICDDGPARGASIVDWHGTTGRDANALVIDQVDAEPWFALLTERLARLGG